MDLICTFGNHTEHATFSITSLGQLAIILGHTWLVEHDPEVDWRTGDVNITHCPESCGVRPADKKPSVENVTDESESLREPPKPHTPAPLEEGDRTFVIFIDQRMETISAGSKVSQQLAE